MTAFRCLCVATLLAISTVLAPARASTAFSTDQSDLWWNPAESGWGMQLVQRGSVIFATLFVYDSFRVPIWYTATLSSVANFVWSGDLFVTTGPWFGTAPFNPNAVLNRRVGTMTWNAPFIDSGTVSYSVDGVSVTKNLVRQLLVFDNYSGTYAGAFHQTAAGCFNPLNNGTDETFAALAVSQSNTNVSLGISSNNGANTCALAGTLSQAGQFGRVIGNYSCNDGDVGTFDMFEMNVSINALNARYQTKSTNFGCTSTGYLGGIRSRP